MQFANMTAVYETVARVIVWLGPDVDDSDLAIERFSNIEALGH